MLQYKDFVYTTVYQMFFAVHSEGWGYGFDCNEKGEIDRDALNPTARANFDYCCLMHADKLRMRQWESRETIPGIMQCECGEKIEIYDHHDVHCEKCYREYNSAGSLLAPRSQWGEETGETAFDYDQGAAGNHGMDEIG